MTQLAHIDFIVKLGGSAITEKSKFETAKIQEIQKVGKVLFSAWQKGVKFIIIHGAGSFGHFQAKEHAVKQGYNNTETPEKVQHGYCLTRLSVCKLNQIITTELCAIGLPVVSLNTACSWTTDNGAVVNHGCAAINKFIRSGFIPILHGDAVLDKLLGCTILSGDTIIKYLCQHFKPSCVLFLSDVDGIYTKPPHQPDAELIRHITVSHNGFMQTSVECGAQLAHDVTGGIRLKLDTSVDIVVESKGEMSVMVCSVGAERAVESACLRGELGDEVGTLIEGDVTDRGRVSPQVKFFL